MNTGKLGKARKTTKVNRRKKHHQEAKAKQIWGDPVGNRLRGGRLWEHQKKTEDKENNCCKTRQRKKKNTHEGIGRNQGGGMNQTQQRMEKKKRTLGNKRETER